MFINMLNKWRVASRILSRWGVRHFHLTLGICCILAMALKLISYFADPIVSRDAALYLHLAQTWFDTNRFEAMLGILNEFWISPLHLFLIKNLMFTGISAETAGIALNILLGSLLPFIGGKTVLEFSANKKAALLTALFIAVQPSFTAFSVEVQREIPYLFLTGCVIWSITAWLCRRKWYLLCIGGALTGLAFLTRFESLEFFPMLALILAILVFYRKLSVRQAVFNGTVFYFSAVVCILLFCLVLGILHPVHDYYSSYFKRKVTHLIHSPEKGTTEAGL